MATPHTRLLPPQKYTFIDVRYNPEGQHCENCRKVVYYVGEVQGKANGLLYYIGMDCAKTVTEQRDFRYHDKQFAGVRKAMKALNEYEKLDRDELAYLVLMNQTIKCYYASGWQSIILEIPQFAVADFSDMISPPNWNKLYPQVQQKLTALGIALPEVPA